MTDKEYMDISEDLAYSFKESNDRLSKYTKLSNSEIFLSKKNIDYLTKKVILHNSVNNFYDNKLLEKKIPELMNSWSNENDIDDFELMYDYLTIKEYLNNDFLKDNSFLFSLTDSEQLNVFRAKGITTTSEGVQSVKKYDEFTCEDFQNMYVAPQDNIFIDSSKFRYNNKIPIWQHSMSRRHYDKSNDGLIASDPNRASLSNPIRGYDMSNIYKGLRD